MHQMRYINDQSYLELIQARRNTSTGNKMETWKSLGMNYKINQHFSGMKIMEGNLMNAINIFQQQQQQY